MTDFEWKDPPPVRRGGRPPFRLSEQQVNRLRSKPGEWARIVRQRDKRFAVTFAQRHPMLEVERRVVKVDGKSRKQYDVYARWPG